MTKVNLKNNIFLEKRVKKSNSLNEIIERVFLGYICILCQKFDLTLHRLTIYATKAYVILN